MKKIYTEDMLLDLKEEEVNRLFEGGKMSDDDVQRWHDLQEEGRYLAEQFVRDELPVLLAMQRNGEGGDTE